VQRVKKALLEAKGKGLRAVEKPINNNKEERSKEERRYMDSKNLQRGPKILCLPRERRPSGRETVAQLGRRRT